MTHGIHHITMIAGDAQQNVDFYAGTLGMRIVKISVNQDDPGTYHFFYGDATGKPGSDLTFFPYPGGRRARPGNGFVGELRLAIPANSTSFWQDRLGSKGVDTYGHEDAFGQKGLGFEDPDGLKLVLVETGDAPGDPWPDMLVPSEAAIIRSIGVTIPTATGSSDSQDSKTSKFIERHLGFSAESEREDVRRYVGADGSYVDVINNPSAPFGQGGHGSVHHVAFRAETGAEQEETLAKLRDEHAPVSDLIDRFWFRSIYFREPGGVLYEVATDGPGFTVDESFEKLGTKVILPPWLEPSRELIERSLPKIVFPKAEATR